MGTVLQTHLSFIKWVTQSSFSSKSSKHHYTQTVNARELNFERMFTPKQVSHFMCNMSNVMCHMSDVMCHMSLGGANRMRVWHQLGLPRPVNQGTLFKCAKIAQNSQCNLRYLITAQLGQSYPKQHSVNYCVFFCLFFINKILPRASVPVRCLSSLPCQSDSLKKVRYSIPQTEIRQK